MTEVGNRGKNANRSGAEFEKRNSFLQLVKQEQRLSYEFLDSKSTGKSVEVPFEIFYKEKLLAKSFHQNQIYKDYLEEEDVFWGDHFVKEVKPDVFVINYVLKKCFVLEMKNQKSQGSVDEKLQSFQFKIDYFEKLLSKSSSLCNFEFEYMYILSDWFYTDNLYQSNAKGIRASTRQDRSQYIDTLEYLNKNNIKHFNFFPLDYVLFNDLNVDKQTF